jgi:hypothetical protein
MKPTWNPPKNSSRKKSKARFLGENRANSDGVLIFLGGWRWTDAEGEGDEALLGGNGIYYDCGEENDGRLREKRDNFRSGRVGSYADRAFGGIDAARMVMRNQADG